MSDAAQTPASADWLAGASLYHVYIRSFQDSSGSGVGDLRGVIDRLPHIVALGVDALWLSPFYASPMEDWGYDVSDHTAVDPAYGAMADFDELVETAHAAGLRIVVDLVFSHTSDRHAWFLESASGRDTTKADWYVWADPKEDGTPPNNWLSAFGGSAWTWSRDREQYYLHDFLPSQPSLDFAQPPVQAALLDIARFWGSRGVDGFRLDTMNSYFHDRDLRDNPPAPAGTSARPRANPFLQQLHLYDRAQRGDLRPLAEFLGQIEAMGAATIVGRIGDRLKAERAGPSCFTYVLPEAGFSASCMAEAIRDAYAASPDARICWAWSNHDTIRHPTRFTTKHADADGIAAICAWVAAVLPGAVTIYQGDELGLEEARIMEEHLRDPFGLRFWPEIHGRDGARTPFPWQGSQPHAGFTTGEPWLPVCPRHVPRSVDRQAGDPRSVLSTYRAALGLRSRLDLATAELVACRSEGDVLMLHVRHGEGSIHAAFNLGQTLQSSAFEGHTVLAQSPGARFEAGSLHLGPGEFLIQSAKAGS